MRQDFKHKPKPDVTSLIYRKVPPQAIDLEDAVLGAIMLEKEKLEDVLEIVYSEQCFYADCNHKIYACIRRLYDKGYPVDLLTITEELRKSGELEAIGGPVKLVELTMGVVSSAHVINHAKIVMEKYMQRELIRISGNTIGEAYDENADVFDLIEGVETNLFELSQPRMARQTSTVSQVVTKVLSNIEEIRATNHDLTGVPSGFESIDRHTNGWQKTDLIILAARPSVGKTAFSLNLALNAVTDKHKPTPTVLFNLEMGDMQLGKRLLSNASGIELSSICRPKQLSPAELDVLVRTNTRLANLGLYIDDTPGLTTMMLKSKLRRLIKKHGVGLAIIDYLQLMTGEKGGNREQEISKISRELKIIAKEFEIPIIALSQLSRNIETRANKEPQLSDLRESGAIEQDADGVMFLSKPSDELIKQDFSLQDKMLFSCKKHRNGDLFDVALNFNKQMQRFTDETIVNPF